MAKRNQLNAALTARLSQLKVNKLLVQGGDILIDNSSSVGVKMRASESKAVMQLQMLEGTVSLSSSNEHSKANFLPAFSTPIALGVCVGDELKAGDHIDAIGLTGSYFATDTQAPTEYFYTSSNVINFKDGLTGSFFGGTSLLS